MMDHAGLLREAEAEAAQYADCDAVELLALLSLELGALVLRLGALGLDGPPEIRERCRTLLALRCALWSGAALEDRPGRVAPLQ